MFVFKHITIKIFQHIIFVEICKSLENEFYDAPCVFSMVYVDFRRRFISLLGYEFHSWSPALALSVLHQPNFTVLLQGLFTTIVLHLVCIWIVLCQINCCHWGNFWPKMTNVGNSGLSLFLGLFTLLLLCGLFQRNQFQFTTQILLIKCSNSCIMVLSFYYEYNVVVGDWVKWIGNIACKKSCFSNTLSCFLMKIFYETLPNLN